MGVVKLDVITGGSRAIGFSKEVRACKWLALSAICVFNSIEGDKLSSDACHLLRERARSHRMWLYLWQRRANFLLLGSLITWTFLGRDHDSMVNHGYLYRRELESTLEFEKKNAIPLFQTKLSDETILKWNVCYKSNASAND